MIPAEFVVVLEKEVHDQISGYEKEVRRSGLDWSRDAILDFVNTRWAQIAIDPAPRKWAQEFIGPIIPLRPPREPITSRELPQIGAENARLFSQGLEVGRRWAATSAEDLDVRGQLIQLEKLRATHPGPKWEEYFDGADMIHSTSKLLFFALDSDAGDDDLAHEEFIGAVFGEDNPNVNSAAYLRGFAEGALEVWGQLKDT
jgi:hypothetical protein